MSAEDPEATALEPESSEATTADDPGSSEPTTAGDSGSSDPTTPGDSGATAGARQLSVHIRGGGAPFTTEPDTPPPAHGPDTLDTETADPDTFDTDTPDTDTSDIATAGSDTLDGVAADTATAQTDQDDAADATSTGAAIHAGNARDQSDADAIGAAGISPRLFGLVVAASAVLAGVVSWITTHPMGPVNDDITNMRLVDQAGSAFDVLLAPVFYTQVAPGHRLLTALQLAVGPLDRVVMHLVIAAMVSGCVVVGSQIMRHLYGRQPWAPIVVCLVMVSPAVIQANIWSASAYHQTPSLLFGLAAVWAWLIHRRSGRRGWLWLSVGLLGCGLSFSARAVIALVFMMAVQHVLLDPVPPGDILQRVWTKRWTWFPYSIPVFIYWELNRSGGTLGLTTDAGVVVAATARGVVEAFIPLLVGIRATGTGESLSAVRPEIVVIAHGLVILLVVILTRRRRDALRGVVVAAVVAATGIGLSTIARGDSLGALAGLSLRYHMEPLAYAVMALLWGLRGARDQDALQGVDAVLLGKWGKVAGVAAIILIAAASVWSTTAVVRAFSGAQSARWLEAVEASVDELDAPPDAATPILDVPLDAAVQPDFPRRRFNDIDWLYDGVAVTTDNATGIDALAVVTADGDIEPIRTTELFSQAGGAYADNGLVSAEGSMEVVGANLCTSSSMSLTVVLAPHDAPRWMEITTTGPALLQADIIPTGEDLAQPVATAATTSARPVAILPMDPFGDVFGARLTVRSPAASPACIEQVRFVAVDNDLPATPLG